MNDIELNAVLYYADFLSLKDRSIPITDTCKYFFIHNTPINSAHIAGVEPIYNQKSKYFKQAKIEYEAVKDKFGEDGVESFVNKITNINACGCVDGVRMLHCIHLFSDKSTKKNALNTYYDWKNNLKYKHIIHDEEGNPREQQCSKYVYHFERMLQKRNLPEGFRADAELPEETAKIILE